MLDLKAYIERLIEKHEYRKLPRGEEALTGSQHHLYEVIRDTIQNSGKRIVLWKEIESTYKRRFSTALNLLPTDFCYNSVNIGSDFQTKFLLKGDKGKFEFVGFNWPASEIQVEVKWSPIGKHVPDELKGITFVVGTYQNGEHKLDFHRYLALYIR